MAQTARYVKLGLFAVLTAGLAIGIALWLGLGLMRPKVSTYHSYFDSSVQGLEVGAPVKFRGVPVGTVEDIGLAPDARHVDVRLGIAADASRELHLDAPNSPIRARAVTPGITGVKIVDLDVVDPAVSPPPRLPFPPDPHTLATAPSTLEGLETGLERVADKLPALLDGLTRTVASLDQALNEVQERDVIGKVAQAIEEIGAVATEVKGVVHQLGADGVAQKVSHALDGLNEATGRVNAVLERVGADGGLVTSAQNAIESFGELGRTTTSSAERLDVVLRDIDGAARAIRELAVELQAQPDMLLKGRARGRRP